MLLQASASGVSGRQVWIAIRLALFLTRIAASLDRLEQIKPLLRADDNVIAARINRVTGFDDDLAITVTAYHFQATDGTHAVEIAVVQALLREHVINFAIQLGFTDQLSWQKSADAPGNSARYTPDKSTISVKFAGYPSFPKNFLVSAASRLLSLFSDREPALKRSTLNLIAAFGLRYPWGKVVQRPQLCWVCSYRCHGRSPP